MLLRKIYQLKKKAKELMNLSRKKPKIIRNYCRIDFIVSLKNSTKKKYLEILSNKLEINLWKEVLLIIIRNV